SSSNCDWQTHSDGSNGGDLTATLGSTSIHLSVEQTTATLTVSYMDGDGAHMQSVELQNFNVVDHLGLTGADQAADQAAVAQMLQDIIKVGGNS
ncbi:MAG: hypothetical protein FWF44_11435, partial [Defluviitaleaceae bacterium]|nr:hypothetical protein [Defluviitaleaceae bacterium]